jgi:hypothetical protein
VPESRLAPGQPVRCARCATTWSPQLTPPPPEPERPRLEERLPLETAPAVPAPEPAPLVADPVERPTPPPPERERRLAGLKIAWIMSFVALAAAAWVAYDRREDVMRAWPASERAYAALGIAGRR